MQYADMSEMSLWVAGEAGQVSLARTAETDAWRAAVDQHAAEVRDALGGQTSAGYLASYARGFVEAAVARGWWPPHRRARDGEWRAHLDWHPDWESLRLAAVCRLFLEAQDLSLLSEYGPRWGSSYRYSPV